MLKSVKNIFKREPESKFPLGLLEGDVEKLRRLRNSREWEALQTALDKHINLLAEAMIASTKTEDVHFYRGAITQLRKFWSYVDELQLYEEHERNLDGARAAIRADRERRARTATYGTPAERTL